MSSVALAEILMRSSSALAEAMMGLCFLRMPVERRMEETTPMMRSSMSSPAIRV